MPCIFFKEDTAVATKKCIMHVLFPAECAFFHPHLDHLAILILILYFLAYFFAYDLRLQFIVSKVQLSNVCRPILVTLSGIVILVRDLQEENV